MDGVFVGGISEGEKDVFFPELLIDVDDVFELVVLHHEGVVPELDEVKQSILDFLLDSLLQRNVTVENGQEFLPSLGEDLEEKPAEGLGEDVQMELDGAVLDEDLEEVDGLEPPLGVLGEEVFVDGSTDHPGLLELGIHGLDELVGFFLVGEESESGVQEIVYFVRHISQHQKL